MPGGALALLNNAYDSDSSESSQHGEEQPPVAATYSKQVTIDNSGSSTTSATQPKKRPRQKRKLPLLESIPDFETSDDSDLDEWMTSGIGVMAKQSRQASSTWNTASGGEESKPPPQLLLSHKLPAPKHTYATLPDPEEKLPAPKEPEISAQVDKSERDGNDATETSTLDLVPELTKPNPEAAHARAAVAVGLGLQPAPTEPDLASSDVAGPYIGPDLGMNGSYTALPEVDEYTTSLKASASSSSLHQQQHNQPPKSRSELRRLERQLHQIGSDGKLSQEVYDQVQMAQLSDAQVRADAAGYATQQPASANTGQPLVQAKLWNNEAGTFTTAIRPSVTSKRKHHINALAVEARQLAAEKLSSRR